MSRSLRAAVLAATVFCTTLPGTPAVARTSPKPTIVFVHGAFADASHFGKVTNRLQDRGYSVVSPANPLRGLASDAAHMATVMRAIDGPIVLVGHSYLIGRRDQAIDPAAQRFMAQRAGAHTVEVDASHASYASHPGQVTKLTHRAARRVGR